MLLSMLVVLLIGYLFLKGAGFMFSVTGTIAGLVFAAIGCVVALIVGTVLLGAMSVFFSPLLLVIFLIWFFKKMAAYV